MFALKLFWWCKHRFCQQAVKTSYALAKLPGGEGYTLSNKRRQSLFNRLCQSDTTVHICCLVSQRSPMARSQLALKFRFTESVQRRIGKPDAKMMALWGWVLKLFQRSEAMKLNALLNSHQMLGCEHMGCFEAWIATLDRNIQMHKSQPDLPSKQRHRLLN